MAIGRRMLSRGFYDALAIWPTVAWAVIISSLFWAFLRLGLMGQRHYGVPTLSEWPGAAVLVWVFVPTAALFEAAMHLYLLWTTGAVYLMVAVPIYIVGWTVLPSLLEDFSPALVLLPALHAVFAAALLVLLGFFDIDFLRAMNAELYGLLTGVPVTL